jgi:hypothetical protein
LDTLNLSNQEIKHKNKKNNKESRMKNGTTKSIVSTDINKPGKVYTRRRGEGEKERREFFFFWKGGGIFSINRRGGGK